jgi:glycosyltransferase involved in cell wall biosynthesis
MMQVVAETIERQGLQHHIHLLGFVPNEKVRELMRTSDVLLVASRTATNGDEEGLPTVLIEAAATGLPIVATDHAGAGELVEDGVSGSLVAEGAPHQLAERLIALAENPVLRQRFATAARGKVEHEFDLADAVARLEAIYDEACLPTQERTPVKTLSVGLRRE